MPLFDDRPRYRSGFGISGSRAPILFGGALAAALGAGWLIGHAHDFLLLPSVLAVGLALLMGRLVGWAHCRNRWIAGAVGASAGLLAYLGYFVFGDNPRLPHREMRRVSYELRDELGVDLPTSVDGPAVLLMFSAGVVLTTGLPAIAAAARTRRAYCPRLRRWLRRETGLLPADAAADFCRALAAGRLREFAAEARVVGPPALCCRLWLEYAPVNDSTVLDHPVYVTLADVPTGRVVLGFGFARRLLRQVLLAPDEARALAPFFAEFELMFAKEKEASAAPPDSAVARITLAPEEYRRRVRSGYFAVKAELIDLTRILLLEAALGLFLGGGLIGIVSMPLVGFIAVPCGVALVACVWFLPSSDRWLEGRMRREIGRRPDRLVDPDDPEALLICWQARVNLLRPNAWPTDLMFLKVSPQQRAILMEGDDRRYVIPAAAVLECDPLKLYAGPWRVRLLVRTNSGPREFLLLHGTGRMKPVTKAQRLRAVRALCARIEALRSDAPAAGSYAASEPAFPGAER